MSSTDIAPALPKCFCQGCPRSVWRKYWEKQHPNPLLECRCVSYTCRCVCKTYAIPDTAPVDSDAVPDAASVHDVASILDAASVGSNVVLVEPDAKISCNYYGGIHELREILEKLNDIIELIEDLIELYTDEIDNSYDVYGICDHSSCFRRGIQEKILVEAQQMKKSFEDYLVTGEGDLSRIRKFIEDCTI